jgi:hypothetical protein
LLVPFACGVAPPTTVSREGRAPFAMKETA